MLNLFSEEEANELVARIDDDGSLDISFEEWRDYLMFHPSSDIKEVVEYWMDDVYEEDTEENLVPGSINIFNFYCTFFSSVSNGLSLLFFSGVALFF